MQRGIICLELGPDTWSSEQGDEASNSREAEASEEGICPTELLNPFRPKSSDKERHEKGGNLFYLPLQLHLVPLILSSSLLKISPFIILLLPLPLFPFILFCLLSYIFLQCFRLFFLFFMFFSSAFIFSYWFPSLFNFLVSFSLALYPSSFLISSLSFYIFSSLLLPFSLVSFSRLLSAKMCVEDLKGLNQVWRTRAIPEYIQLP